MTAVALSRCLACSQQDHALCAKGGCECRHGSWYEGDVIPPPAGTKGRRNWIGRHAPPVALGPVHLHALYNRGRVMWVLAGSSGLCKQEGRCQRVYLATPEHLLELL